MKNGWTVGLGIAVAIGIGVAGYYAARADSGKGEEALPELKVVDRVELARYLGKWYSVAEIPQFFSKPCAGGTTATYSLREDGDIEVYNACFRENGSVYDITGRAWVADPVTNAKLLVSFLPGGIKIDALAGDYWIIDLGPDYEYAVVGNPGRNTGWVLSRTPELPDDTLKGIAERLTAQGYDYSKFQRVNQKDFPSPSP